MNNWRNERGAVLVISLLFITIVLLLLLVLFQQATSTFGQVSVMEKRIQAKHMADMGLTYYKQAIFSEKATLEEVASSVGIDGVVEVVEEINATIPLHVQIESDKLYFEIDQITITEENENEITIQYRITGIADERKVQEENEIILSITEGNS